MLRIAEIWRYPVKGMRGEALTEVEVAEGGIPGDRGLTVVDERGVVTGRRKQRMIGVPSALDGDGATLVDGHAWDSGEATALVREVAGATAKLARPAGGHEHDDAEILIVSDGSIAQLGYDRRRFRPNFLLAGADGPVELGWIGHRVRIGGAVLRVDEPCERCVITTLDPDTAAVNLDVLRRTNEELDGNLGVYCKVIQPGAVHLGDAVEVIG